MIERLWQVVTGPWRRRAQSKKDLARRAERVHRDDARVAELRARESRIVRENHLGADIMAALRVRGNQ